MEPGVPPLPEDAPAAPCAGATAAFGVGHLVADVRHLMDSARGVLWSQLQLLALEAQRAGRALGWLAAYGVAAGLLLASAWLGLSVACALWLMEQGVRPSVALVACSLVNIGGLLLVGIAMRRASVALSFPATRKSLQTPSGTQVRP